MNSNNQVSAHPAKGGSDWGGEMSRARRLSLYLRGNMSCAACGASEVPLSLDHVDAHQCGGDNSDSNLVVLCGRCNSSKSDTPLAIWLAAGGHKVLGLSASAEAVELIVRRHAAAVVDYPAGLAVYRAEQDRKNAKRRAKRAA